MIRKYKSITAYRIFQIIFTIIGVVLIITGVTFIPSIIQTNKIIEREIKLDDTDEWVIVEVNAIISTNNYKFMEEFPIKFEITVNANGPELTWQYHYCKIYIKSDSDLSSEGISFEYFNAIAEKQWLYPSDPTLTFVNELPRDGDYYIFVELYDKQTLGGDGKLIDSRRSETFKVYSKEEIYRDRNEMNNKFTLSIALFVGGPTFLGLVIGLQTLIIKLKTLKKIEKDKNLNLRKELRRR